MVRANRLVDRLRVRVPPSPPATPSDPFEEARMTPSPLARKTCVPCKGDVPPMPPREIAEYLKQVPGWQAVNDHHLVREFRFPDFLQALAATNRIGQLAE